MAPSGLLARAADANGLRMPRNACALVLGTLLLAACNRQPPAPAAAVVVPPDAGVVAITADARGFTPAEVHVSKGKAVTFLFTRTTDNTCAKEVVFPERNPATATAQRGGGHHAPGTGRAHLPVSVRDGDVGGDRRRQVTRLSAASRAPA